MLKPVRTVNGSNNLGLAMTCRSIIIAKTFDVCMSLQYRTLLDQFAPSAANWKMKQTTFTMIPYNLKPSLGTCGVCLCRLVMVDPIAANGRTCRRCHHACMLSTICKLNLTIRRGIACTFTIINTHLS